MKTNIQTTIETITPKQAELLLKKNSKNRNLSEARVKRWADIMKRGLWRMNTEALKFSKAGNLLDGQHRLAAVVLSGVPVDFMIHRGLPEELMATLDLGKVRTCGDHLRMQGWKGNTAVIAAATSLCVMFRSGDFVEYKTKLAPQDMLRWLETNPGLARSARIIEEYKGVKDLLPASVAVALHFLFSKHNRDKAETFFHHLNTGEGLSKTSPILKLRTQLISMKGETKRNRWNRRVFLYYTCAAFKAFLEGRRAEASFQYRPDYAISLPGSKRKAA